MNAKGRAFCYGADIDTDVIIPARFLNTSDPKELATHCMEDSKQDINAGLPVFSKRVQPGDLIVAQKNFGCGSSREHAPIAIKACGVSCVIAKSFARIFFRNAINIGLPILENQQLPDEVQKGDKIEVDLANGIIYNRTQNKEYKCAKYEGSIAQLIEEGGLVNYTKKKLGV